jgi:hypothetical protein
MLSVAELTCCPSSVAGCCAGVAPGAQGTGLRRVLAASAAARVSRIRRQFALSCQMLGALRFVWRCRSFSPCLGLTLTLPGFLAAAACSPVVVSAGLALVRSLFSSARVVVVACRLCVLPSVSPRSSRALCVVIASRCSALLSPCIANASSPDLLPVSSRLWPRRRLRRRFPRRRLPRRLWRRHAPSR